MKKGTVSIVIGLLLITAALSLTGYNFLDNYKAGKAAEKALEQIIPLINNEPVSEQERETAENAADENFSEEIEYPDYVLNPEMDMPVKNIDGNDYIGVLSLPSIERELPVQSEWNYSNLKTAPCRYWGSAYLDNMVICAHNYDIHFGSLKYLNYGDEVIFTDMDGNIFRYSVAEIITLEPTAIEEMTAGNCGLTLFTCTVGGAARITVRCERG